uniref:MRG domain-containing protein n=1 Tax=Panagrolaimus sp. JU765 TaxID=591449 RepID=A0AC34RN94_9BILA
MGGVKRKASEVRVAKRLRLSEDVASSPVPSGDGSVSRSSPMASVEEVDMKPTTQPPVEYEVNTKVLCQHTDNNFYEAKIIKVDHDGLGNPRYTIHYNGWNARYDEVISHEEAITRFTEYNEENLEFAKRSLQNAKKNRKSGGKRDDRSSKSGRRSVNSRTTGTITPSLDQTIEPVVEQPVEEVEPEPIIPTPLKTKALLPNIPEEINNLLVKDNENITSNKLLKLPARKTLSEIFDEFLKAYQQKKAKAKDVMEERIR